MTWQKLCIWASRHDFYVGSRYFPHLGRAFAEFSPIVDGPSETRIIVWRKTEAAAKRSLCRIMKRILEATP